MCAKRSRTPESPAPANASGVVRRKRSRREPSWRHRVTRTNTDFGHGRSGMARVHNDKPGPSEYSRLTNDYSGERERTNYGRSCRQQALLWSPSGPAPVENYCFYDDPQPETLFGEKPVSVRRTLPPRTCKTRAAYDSRGGSGCGRGLERVGESPSCVGYSATLVQTPHSMIRCTVNKTSQPALVCRGVIPTIDDTCQPTANPTIQHSVKPVTQSSNKLVTNLTSEAATKCAITTLTHSVVERKYHTDEQVAVESSVGHTTFCHTVNRCDGVSTNSGQVKLPSFSTSVSQSLQNQEDVVAFDCEMVGCEPDLATITMGGLRGKRKRPKQVSVAGRCSIVDYHGNVLYDKYIRPTQKILTLRSRFSGITCRKMKKAIPIDTARREVVEILRGKVVVAHNIKSDLDALSISVPTSSIRDTSCYPGLRIMAGLSPQVTPSLKKLTLRLLGKEIQTGPHCSVVDARSTMELYRLVEDTWEKSLKTAVRNDDRIIM